MWLEHDLGVKLRSNGLDRAASRVRAATLPWLLVDESLLDLDLAKALIVFPGSGRRRTQLAGQLVDLGVVRQLLVTRSRRDVLCILVYRSHERDDLFRAVEALDEPFVWEELLEEDRQVEGQMWTELARRTARDENLLE